MKSENESPLERYFRALESIAISPHGLSVSEIAQTCDLPVGTAHRLLQNLQRTGLITTNGEKRKDYRLGERLLRLLHAGTDGAWLSIAVQPILNDLANRLEETCYLARLAGHEIVSTAWATPSSGLRGYVVPGYKMSPHVAASAKAILAFQSPGLIDKALAEPLPKLTRNTKTDRASIDREYAQVRKQGYATCWDEMEIGLGAIAVPISLPDAGVIYSIGIAGLIDRLTRRSERESVKVLQSSVEMLSRALRDLRPPEHTGSPDRNIYGKNVDVERPTQ